MSWRVAIAAIAIPHANANPNRSSPPSAMPSAAMTSDAARATIQSSDASDSKREQPHAMVAPAAHVAEVDVQDLALAACPARALRPQRPERRRDLHADERVRLVDGFPAGQQQLPGQVDVLGGHPRVVAADGQHAVAAKQPENAGDDADPASQGLGAADQADDRGRLQHLHGEQESAAVGDVRRAGDGGDHR